MTFRGAAWTTQDLELFHDGQLDAARSSQLSADLCRDSTLRERLARIRRLDEQVQSFLLNPREAGPAPASRLSRTRPALAFLLPLTGAAAWLLLGRSTPNAPIKPAKRAAASSVRVVFSIPLPSDGIKPVRETAVEPTPDDRTFQDRLGRALAAGRVHESLELLAGAPADRRRAAYRYMGELLQSAQMAEQLLDNLSAAEQLAVCREWASEPAFRPTVFARLRRLSEEPDMAGDVHLVLAQLSLVPELRAWVIGYQLYERG